MAWKSDARMSEVKAALEQILTAGHRAGDIIRPSLC
jgi:hypothetical protein